MIRKLEEYCNKDSEVFYETINETEVVCVEDKFGIHRCKRIIKSLKDKSLKHTDEVYIAPRECLVKAFKSDKSVKSCLIYDKGLGMCRNKLSSNKNTSVPTQTLAVTDHSNYKYLTPQDIDKEIVQTILHEDEHLGGEKSENKAEKKAEDKINKNT